MRPRLISLLIAAAVITTACGPSDSDFSELSSYRSPDGSYHVIIDSARSRLAFGAETIRVYVVDKQTRVRNHIVTTRIANDGGGIGETNLKAVWVQPDVIRLCLSGAEQEDSVLEINAGSLSHTEVNKACSG